MAEEQRVPGLCGVDSQDKRKCDEYAALYPPLDTSSAPSRGLLDHTGELWKIAYKDVALLLPRTVVHFFFSFHKNFLPS